MHRDDIPFEDAEAITKALQKLHPGFNVQFAGDVDSPELNKKVEEFQKYQEKMVAEGKCTDCGKIMPNINDIENDDWQPAEGWKHFVKLGTEEIIAWQCPECDKEDQ